MTLKKRANEAADHAVAEFKRLRSTCGDAEAFAQVGKKFHETVFPDDSDTSANYMNRLYSLTIRKKITEAFPEFKGSKIIPRVPEAIQYERNASGITQVTEYVDKPIKIDADKMIDIAIAGLKKGLEDKIYPEVKLCLSFLICVRSNDMNPNFVRSNGVMPKYGDTHSMIEQCPGTFCMLPSKQKEGNEYKDFCNVTIVKPEHYPLVEKAIVFLLDPTNAKRPCYCGTTSYQQRKECGAQTRDCQWSGKVYGDMVDHVGFKAAILDWNGWENEQKICETFGRRFVACCIHKEIIQFDDQLNVGWLAADLCLGHVKGSSATRPYLRYNVRPTQIPGVVLKKVQEDNPIVISEDKKITQGLYLERTP